MLSLHKLTRGCVALWQVYVRDRYLNLVKSASVLERGLTATLTSWAVNDTARAGCHLYHDECRNQLTCPPFTKVIKARSS